MNEEILPIPNATPEERARKRAALEAEFGPLIAAARMAAAELRNDPEIGEVFGSIDERLQTPLAALFLAGAEPSYLVGSNDKAGRALMAGIMRTCTGGGFRVFMLLADIGSTDVDVQVTYVGPEAKTPEPLVPRIRRLEQAMMTDDAEAIREAARAFAEDIPEEHRFVPEPEPEMPSAQALAGTGALAALAAMPAPPTRH